METDGIARSGVSRRAFWWVVGLIVLNHLVLDPVLTVYRMHTPPGAYELNPIWRDMIQSDPWLFLAIQVPAIVLVFGGFAAVLWFVDRASPPWDRRSMSAVWWASLVVLAWGLLSTAHHLWYLGIRWL